MNAKIKINTTIAQFMGYEIISYKGRQIYNGNKFAQTVGEKIKIWGGLSLEFTGRYVEDAIYPFDTIVNLWVEQPKPRFLVCIHIHFNQTIMTTTSFDNIRLQRTKNGYKTFAWVFNDDVNQTLEAFIEPNSRVIDRFNSDDEEDRAIALSDLANAILLQNELREYVDGDMIFNNC